MIPLSWYGPGLILFRSVLQNQRFWRDAWWAVVGQVRTQLQDKPEPSPQMGQAHLSETDLAYVHGRIGLFVPADTTILRF